MRLPELGKPQSKPHNGDLRVTSRLLLVCPDATSGFSIPKSTAAFIAWNIQRFPPLHVHLYSPRANGLQGLEDLSHGAAGKELSPSLWQKLRVERTQLGSALGFVLFLEGGWVFVPRYNHGVLFHLRKGFLKIAPIPKMGKAGNSGVNKRVGAGRDDGKVGVNRSLASSY